MLSFPVGRYNSGIYLPRGLGHTIRLCNKFPELLNLLEGGTFSPIWIPV